MDGDKAGQPDILKKPFNEAAPRDVFAMMDMEIYQNPHAAADSDAPHADYF